MAKKMDRTKPTPTDDLIKLPHQGLAEELIAQLEAERERQGLTKTALAEKMGVPLPRLTDWTRGKCTPGLDFVGRWLAALGIEMQVCKPAAPSINPDDLTIEHFARILAAHSRRQAKRVLNDIVREVSGPGSHSRACDLDVILKAAESHPRHPEILSLKKIYEKP